MPLLEAIKMETIHKMGLNLENLDLDNVRKLMLEEFENDIKGGNIYMSRRLKEESREIYIDLMKKAILTENDISLAKGILENNCLKSMLPRRTRTGRITMARVPVNAHETLAEGEFNRFYIRALCRKVMQEGGMIEVYRCKQVHNPRPKSEELIGKIIQPKLLLSDLRTNIGEEPSLKMPGGPNSGISVRLKI